TLLRPPVAFALWAVNLAVWHVPWLYDLALQHAALHDLEHLCWVVAGLLVWTLLVDPVSPLRVSHGGRVVLAGARLAAGETLTAAALNAARETLAADRLPLAHLLQNARIADTAALLGVAGLTAAMRGARDRRGARLVRAREALPARVVASHGTHIEGFYEGAL